MTSGEQFSVPPRAVALVTCIGAPSAPPREIPLRDDIGSLRRCLDRALTVHAGDHPTWAIAPCDTSLEQSSRTKRVTAGHQRRSADDDADPGGRATRTVAGRRAVAVVAVDAGAARGAAACARAPASPVLA